VRDIARLVGITDAAIYYHFSSKQELLEALVEEKGFIHRLQALEQVVPRVPLREQLAAIARGAVEIMDENRDFLRLIVVEGLAGDQAMSNQYKRLVGQWERALTTVLSRYQEQGDLTGVDLESLARQIIYIILGPFLDSWMGRRWGPELDAHQRRQALASFAAEAIARLPLGQR